MDFPLVPSLVLLVVAGWLWADGYFPLRWHYKRTDGNRLYFAAVLHGAWISLSLYVLLIVANAFVVFFDVIFLRDKFIWPHFSTAKLQLTETYIYIVVFASIPFTLILRRLVNKWFVKKPSRFLESLRALYKDTDELSLLMLESMLERRPMIFSLANGKVYIGQATEMPGPDSDKETITFMPIVSGQRDAKGKIVWTTPYIRNDEKTGEMVPLNESTLNPGSKSSKPLMLTIAIQHIVTFHFYNFDAYSITERQPAKSAETQIEKDSASA